MTSTDYKLEQLYKSIADRPQRKFEDTITTFNRDIFWYNRDELHRQVENTNTERITYETHRKVIETAVNIMRKDTPHDIALCILTHRFFAAYRANVFAGEGTFTTDYTFLLTKISMIFNQSTGTIPKTNIAAKLKEYKKPTLVQVNHITGTVSEVITPDTGETLNEWAIKFNQGAPVSTSYRIAGLKIGV